MYVLLYTTAPALLVVMSGQAFASFGVKDGALEVRNWIRTRRVPLKDIDSAVMARTSVFGMTGWLPQVSTSDGKKIKVHALGGTPLRGDELGQEWVDWINAHCGPRPTETVATAPPVVNTSASDAGSSSPHILRLLSMGALALAAAFAVDHFAHLGVVIYALSAASVRFWYLASLRRESKK
jgi:hypothetical protein